MSQDDCSLADANHTATPEDVEVVRVFDAYLADVQAGRSPDPERLLAEHPALADRLRAFLNVTDHVDQVAGDPEPTMEDYRIIGEIGRGGMGIVYEAEQISRGRRVALKILPTAAALDPRPLRRFQVEIQAAQLLRHPHIVPIAAFGCERGVYFYAMQYVEGRDLAALLAELRQAREDFGTASLHPKESPSGICPVDSDDPAGVPPSDGPGGPVGPVSTGDRGFFRRVARWGIQAAEALDYAHGQGVLHRDIKPSNLLIDVRDNLWVTDFGLAQVNGEDGGTRTGDLLGTLRYMSPEQALAQRVVIDGRTDIYSLGATLYELLTLHPAFEGRDRQELLRRIAQDEPRPPRRFNPEIPRDLETIVLKAIAKEREDRYTTAKELAEDLDRFLNDAPIRARRPNLMDRATRWAHRHRSTAAAGIIVGAIALVTIGVGGILIGRARAEAARHIAAKALAEARLAEERDLASRRELALQAIQRTLMAPHQKGWSVQVWTEVSRAAGLCEVPQLQPLAVAALVGLDAETRREFRDFGARSLAFDPNGRLLMGGVTDPHYSRSRKRLGTRLWDGIGLQQPEDLGTAADGPVGFRADDSPVQLVVNEQEKTLTLVDLSRRVASRRFDVPGVLLLDNGDASPPVGMLPDGSLVAAPVRAANDKSMLVVWDGQTGKVLHQFEAECRSTAFSPDGAFVAAGDAAGQVVLWSMATGRTVSSLDAGNRINVLSFGRNPRFSPDGPGPEPSRRRWQLAAGDGGGNVTVWDLGSEIPRVRSICRGSYNEVFALSFSPDGSVLASAGRGFPRLWDPATGQVLLSIDAGHYQYGLAFSPDGRRLAIGSDDAWGKPGRVLLLDLIDRRGVQTLRGLSGLIATAIFSPDGRLVAAISQDWRVGIWERETGRLKLVLNVPPGLYQDNTALALSPDNRLLAFSSDRRAALWEIETGRRIGTWALPVGLQDRLVFDGPGRLLLARMETTDPEVAPYDSDAGKYPRSCAIYDLLGKSPKEPIRRLTAMSLGTENIALAPDATTVVLDGYLPHPSGRVRSIEAYDLATGERRWALPVRSDAYWQSRLVFDPGGGFLEARTSPDDSVLIDVRSGLGQAGGDRFGTPGPGAKLGIGGSSTEDQQWLMERGRDAPLLRIDARTTPAGLDRFSGDGRFVVGASPLGDWITVCDLAEIQRRLTDVGLW